MIHPNQVDQARDGLKSRKGLFRSLPVISMLFLAAIIFLKLYWTQDENNLLARIGSRVIDHRSFIARYEILRARIDVPDNVQSRRQIFNRMLEEELLIAEAENRGYRQDAHGRFQSERIQIQELLDAFHRRFISDEIAVHEKELRQLFVRLNTKVKARHLYAPTLEQAERLYAALVNGKSFDELARENFKDPQLRDSGGALEYFTADEMDPFFEEAAFALRLGQISKPIRTAQGYSIIQVQDRITKPLLTESEFLQRRTHLEQYWCSRRVKQATRFFVDSLRQYLEISCNKPVVVELFQALTKRSSFAPAMDIGQQMPNDERWNQQELVRSKLGVWQVKTFHEHAQFTSEGQLQWLRNEENFEDFIAGLVVRAHMLAEAKRLGLHRTKSYRTAIKQKMDDDLLKRMEETISNGIIIPEDSLRVYFQEHRDNFVIPPKIHLREIVLRDESQAATIRRRLLHNVPFEKLAKTYSVRKWSAENEGDLGSFSARELGRYVDRVFPLEVGQWVGPIKMDTLYAFFKCAGKASAKERGFDEVRVEIAKSLKPIWQKRARHELLETIRRNVEVVAFPERLQSIQLN